MVKKQNEAKELKAKLKKNKKGVKLGTKNKINKIKKPKNKKIKPKTNWKLAFREFPIKLAKDIARIRWISQGRLGKSFLFILGFLIVFAIFYFGLDSLLKLITTSSHIIKG